MNLADALIPRSFDKDSQIIKQGEAADGMYFIEEGTVSVRIQQEAGGETEISVLGKGLYFGELALVTHRARAASVYAVDNVKVACKLNGGNYHIVSGLSTRRGSMLLLLYVLVPFSYLFYPCLLVRSYCGVVGRFQYLCVC